MTVERILPGRRSAAPFASPGAAVAPFQFVLDGNEFLRASMLSDGANGVVRIQGRLLRPTGEIANFAFELRNTIALTTVEEEYQLGEGALLSVFALPTSASSSTTWGDIYVSLTIVRGRGDNAVELGVLVQSYVAFKQPAVWPGTPFRSALDGPPKPYAVVIPAPAAGASCPFSGTTGYRLRMSMMQFNLVTSAAAGNRYIVINLFKSGLIPASVGCRVPQPPSTGYTYTAMFGGTTDDASAATRVAIGLPAPFYLDDVDQITVTAAGAFAAGDQISTVTIYAERWLVPPGMGTV